MSAKTITACVHVVVNVGFVVMASVWVGVAVVVVTVVVVVVGDVIDVAAPTEALASACDEVVARTAKRKRSRRGWSRSKGCH